MAKKKKPGVERRALAPETMLALEKDFRSGLMSWKAMGDKYGVGMSWLKSTQDDLGWTRNLVTKIHDGAKRKDQERIAREVRDDLPPDYKLSEKEVTDSNIDLIATVTGSHRKLLSRARGVAEKMLDSMEKAKDADDLPAPAALKQLVDSLKVIISTEREILRIEDEAPAETAVSTLIGRVMGSCFKPVAENAADGD